MADSRIRVIYSFPSIVRHVLYSVLRLTYPKTTERLTFPGAVVIVSTELRVNSGQITSEHSPQDCGKSDQNPVKLTAADLTWKRNNSTVSAFKRAQSSYSSSNDPSKILYRVEMKTIFIAKMYWQNRQM